MGECLPTCRSLATRLEIGNWWVRVGAQKTLRTCRARLAVYFGGLDASRARVSSLFWQNIEIRTCGSHGLHSGMGKRESNRKWFGFRTPSRYVGIVLLFILVGLTPSELDTPLDWQCKPMDFHVWKHNPFAKVHPFTRHMPRHMLLGRSCSCRGAVEHH
jgi:hypothetical protein